MNVLDLMKKVRASLSIGDVSVEFDLKDLTQIYWALQAKHARLDRERPDRPEFAENVRDIQERLKIVYAEVVALERLACSYKPSLSEEALAKFENFFGSEQ